MASVRPPPPPKTAGARSARPSEPLPRWVHESKRAEYEACERAHAYVCDGYQNPYSQNRDHLRDWDLNVRRDMERIAEESVTLFREEKVKKTGDV